MEMFKNTVKHHCVAIRNQNNLKHTQHPRIANSQVQRTIIFGSPQDPGKLFRVQRNINWLQLQLFQLQKQH